MKVTQMSQVHNANLVADSGYTAYGAGSIEWRGTSLISSRHLFR